MLHYCVVVPVDPHIISTRIKPDHELRETPPSYHQKDCKSFVRKCVFDRVRKFTTLLPTIFFTPSRIWHTPSFSRALSTALDVLCLNYSTIYITAAAWIIKSRINQVFNPLRTLHFIVIPDLCFRLHELCLGLSLRPFVSHGDLWPPLATSSCFLHNV